MKLWPLGIALFLALPPAFVNASCALRLAKGGAQSELPFGFFHVPANGFARVTFNHATYFVLQMDRLLAAEANGSAAAKSALAVNSITT